MREPQGLSEMYSWSEGASSRRLWGPRGFAPVMEARTNPTHVEYKNLLTDWLEDHCPGFDPNKFDKQQLGF
jgi:hypothetical protein